MVKVSPRNSSVMRRSFSISSAKFDSCTTVGGRRLAMPGLLDLLPRLKYLKRTTGTTIWLLGVSPSVGSWPAHKPSNGKWLIRLEAIMKLMLGSRTRKAIALGTGFGFYAWLTLSALIACPFLQADLSAAHHPCCPRTNA